MTDQPRFFHISPDNCGAERLARLFQDNQYQVACHEKGSLAEDIVWSAATDMPPLQRWQNATLFAGLYRISQIWRPALEAWRCYDFLHRQFPDAYFILTTRDTDAWLLDRLTKDAGIVARVYARHLGVDEEELPEIWEQEMAAHLAAVSEYFVDDPHLIRVDLDSDTPADLCSRLSAILPLTTGGDDGGWFGESDEIDNKLVGRLFQLLDIPQTEPAEPDEEYIEDIAAFCLKGIAPPFDRTELAGASVVGCVWDGRSSMTNKWGEPSPLRLWLPPGASGPIAISPPGNYTKSHRTEAVINQMLEIGRPDPVCIDMQDSRWMGSEFGQPIGRPVLCYNRRQGARNAVLWPLSGYYGPDAAGFTTTTPDQTDFDSKQDRLVWRGMISGAERTTGGQPGRGSHVFLRALREAGDDSKARQQAWDQLCQTSRMSVVRRWFGHTDMDIGVVMAWSFREFANDPFLAPYCGPRQRPAFFHGFRYQLAMSGYDFASNFIPMINSQSVLLKEEDGWEVYFSGRFKPWKHYIPLQRYCDDLEEKLNWARENTNECKEISRAARAEVARLSDRKLTNAILQRVLDGVAAAG